MENSLKNYMKNNVIDNDEVGIEKHISADLREVFNIIKYEKISSTNTVLKDMAKADAKEWTVLIANEQTNGKGRMNRNFYSPCNSGIYMSVLLKPDFLPSQTLFLTPMTAVVVSEAIDKVLNVCTGIKWVNDIYLNDKKVCGILAEGAISKDGLKNDYVVIGIGINISNPDDDFPSELKEIAGSLISDKNLENKELFVENLKNKLIAEILTKMYKYYNANDKAFMKEYKNKSILINKEVYILGDENKEKWKVIDIDASASLVVENKEGIIKTISSGEVSVRLF
ncbi:MAG: biotin--[Lachnospiraceae bacterium]|nr:biotin--[acetyl-CoA-carboxylase] ligase [Lachnospiraceae bacterium]